jgi:hypothetical protein
MVSFKNIEDTSLLFMSSTVINWLLNGGDILSKFISLLVGALTVIMLLYSIKEKRLNAKIKEKRLEKLEDGIDTEE